MRRDLRFALIAIGVVLVALGPLALLYTYSAIRPFLPEAEAFEELGTYPPTLWGQFVWISHYVGMPLGILLLALAFSVWKPLRPHPTSSSLEE